MPFENPVTEKLSPSGSVSFASTVTATAFPAVVVALSSTASTVLLSTSPTTTVTVAVS